MGRSLTALLDEFRPTQIVFSAGVERMVRRLLVIKEALMKDRKDRGSYFEKKLAFMGIGGGALRATRELLYLR